MIVHGGLTIEHGRFITHLVNPTLFGFVIGPGTGTINNEPTMAIYRVSSPDRGGAPRGVGHWLVRNLVGDCRDPTDEELAEFVEYMLTH